MANRLISLCLQSDISCENIMIRKTFEVVSSLKLLVGDDVRHRRCPLDARAQGKVRRKI